MVPSVRQPSDLDVVRESYDRVAGTYVELGVGELWSTLAGGIRA